jgi:hypothetical protein
MKSNIPDDYTGSNIIAKIFTAHDQQQKIKTIVNKNRACSRKISFSIGPDSAVTSFWATFGPISMQVALQVQNF